MEIKSRNEDPFLIESSETMNTFFIRTLLRIRQIIEDEQGQDLVEYALVVAVVAFGTITGMGYLARGINHAFSGIATTLTSNV